MSEHGQPFSTGDRSAGVMLVVASLLTVFTMAHHPTHSHGTGSLGAIVHGTMIVLLAILLYGFLHFALRRGLEKPLVLMGLVSYCISAIAHLLAATTNGFIAPTLARRESPGVSHDILILCWESNQAFARVGVFATGIAFALWSIGLLARNDWANRLIGTIGLLSGIAPAVSLIGGRPMDVPTAFAIYAAHATWAVLIGVQLIRRRVGEASTAPVES